MIITINLDKVICIYMMDFEEEISILFQIVIIVIEKDIVQVLVIV